MIETTHPEPEQLAAYADGGIRGSAEHAVLTEHLAACDECRRVMAAAVVMAEDAYLAADRRLRTWWAWALTWAIIVSVCAAALLIALVWG